jgi:2-oxoglutarate ferredoxin oxidoreductase subunit delta
MADDERSEEPAEDRPRRKSRGRVFILPDRCKGCAYCVEFCPTRVLALSDGFNQKGYHPPVVVDEGACTGCGLCGMYCPDFAIYGVRVKKTEPGDANENGAE